jgi:hypothetical protein
MQLELQNLWRPVLAVLVLAWLLSLGLTASHDFNNLNAEPQLPGHSIPVSITTNTSDPAVIEYSSIADMFLMGTVEQTVTPEITLAQLPDGRHLSVAPLYGRRGRGFDSGLRGLLPRKNNRP